MCFIGAPLFQEIMDPYPDVPPPRQLFSALNVPQRLLLGPGPSNSHLRVLTASSHTLLGHLHHEFTQIMDEVKTGIQYAFQTRYSWTMAVSGTGHAAMECALMNTVEPGDVVLVARNGIWGKRAANIATRIGGNVVTIRKAPGDTFTNEDIEEALATHKPQVMFICSGESSTGALQPLVGIGKQCHRHDCLLIADAVASLGAVAIQTDEQEIDVIYTGSQKVLGVSPGLSPIAFSQRARDKLSLRKTAIPSFYFDAKELANYWGCEGSPRKYHHTAPISCMYALREGLSLLVEEGLTHCQKRHRDTAKLLWKGLEDLGLELFVKQQHNRLPTITAVHVPADVEWDTVIKYILKVHSIEISGGLGPTAGTVWRIGLMGVNATSENVEKVLYALKDALEKCRQTNT